MKIQLSRTVTALLGLIQAMLVQNHSGGFFTEINIVSPSAHCPDRMRGHYRVDGRLILSGETSERVFFVRAKPFTDSGRLELFELSMLIEGRGGSNFASFHYENSRWDWSPMMKS